MGFKLLMILEYAWCLIKIPGRWKKWKFHEWSIYFTYQNIQFQLPISFNPDDACQLQLSHFNPSHPNRRNLLIACVPDIGCKGNTPQNFSQNFDSWTYWESLYTNWHLIEIQICDHTVKCDDAIWKDHHKSPDVL